MEVKRVALRASNEHSIAHCKFAELSLRWLERIQKEGFRYMPYNWVEW